MAEGPEGMDLATLGLRIDASEFRGEEQETERRLDKLDQAGRKVEERFEKISQATQKAARSQSTYGTAAETEAERRLRQERAAQARFESTQRERAQRRAREAEQRRRQVIANAVEEAKARADALERQYRLDIARIREGQARQFLTAEEAAQAGREAGRRFNQGIVGELDRAAQVVPRTSGEGQAILGDLGNRIKNVDEAAQQASTRGLGRLNRTLSSVARRAAGAHPAVGQLANTLSSFAVGTAATTGILAGVTAIGFGISKLTEEFRENRKAIEEAREAAREFADQQEREAFGAGLDPSRQATELGARIEFLRGEIERVRSLDPQRGGLVGGAADPAILLPLQEELVDLARDRALLLQQASDEREEEAETLQRSLSSLEQQLERERALTAAREEGEAAVERVNLAFEERGALAEAAERFEGEQLERAQELIRARFELQRAEIRAREEAELYAGVWRGIPEVIDGVSPLIRQQHEELARARREAQRFREALGLEGVARAVPTGPGSRREGPVDFNPFGVSADPSQFSGDSITEESLAKFDAASRSVVSLADSAGLLEGSARDAARGLSDIMGGLATFDAAEGTFGKAVGAIGAVSGFASAFGGFIDALTSRDDRRRQEELRLARERNALLKSNEATLRGLFDREGVTAAEFAATGSAFEALPRTTRSDLPLLIGGLTGEVDLNPAFAAKEREQLVAFLDEFGISVEAFIRAIGELNIDLFTESGKLIPEAIDQIIEATDKYREEVQRQEDLFLEELEVRRLFAQGQDEEAQALRRRLQEEEEIRRAREAGFSEEAIAALEAVQAEERLAEARRESMRVVEQLADFQDQLALGSLSTLSPTQQFMEARNQFGALRELALGGDVSAAESLPEAARRLLEASRAVNASGAGFASTFEFVNETIDAVQEAFEDRATLEEQMLEEERRTREGVERVVEEVTDVGVGIERLVEAVISASADSATQERAIVEGVERVEDAIRREGVAV